MAIMGRFLKKQKTDPFKKLSSIDAADKKTQTMLALALLLKVLQESNRKNTVGNYAFYLSKMIALSFCLLM